MPEPLNRRDFPKAAAVAVGKADFNGADGAINHFRKYTQSILANETPIAPTVGMRADISGHMATTSKVHLA